jgi:hypothetical protein
MLKIFDDFLAFYEFWIYLCRNLVNQRGASPWRAANFCPARAASHAIICDEY